MTKQLSNEEFLEVVERAPLVAVDLLVLNEEHQVLLGLRNNEPAKDTWYFPGGRIRKGERIAETITRLITQELGISPTSPDLRMSVPAFNTILEHSYSANFAGKPGVTTHYITLVYGFVISTGSLKPDSQHRELKWFDGRSIYPDTKVHRNVKTCLLHIAKNENDIAPLVPQ